MKYRKVYVLLSILCLWLVLHIGINERIIPSPFDTITRFIILLPSVLLPHGLASLGRILIAVLGTLLIGIPIGLFLGMNFKADKYVSPVLFAFYPVPKIAFLPVLMLLFGLGNSSKIILIGMVVIFQIIIHLRDGVRKIPKEYYYAMESMGGKSIHNYIHLVLPATLPNLLTALRISTGTSLSVLFFAENFATDRGLGYFIMDSWMKLAYVDMFAGIMMMSFIGILLFKGIDFMEKRCCQWVFLSSRGI